MNDKILIEFHGWRAEYCVYHFFLKVLKKKYRNIKVEAFATFPNFFTVPTHIKYLNHLLFFIGIFFKVRSFKKFKLLGVDKIFMPFIKNKHKFLSSIFYRRKKKIITKYNLLDLKIDNILIGDLIYDSYLKTHNVPTLNVKDKLFVDFFLNYVSLYYYWREYFNFNNLKAVIVVHPSYLTGLPSRIAAYTRVKSICASSNCVYSLSKKRIYAYKNFLDYKKIFTSLKNKKQIRIIAKKDLSLRLNGKIINVDSHFSGWQNQKHNSEIKKSLIVKKKIKVLISPHLFSDTPHALGKLLFPDVYEWLIFILNISRKTDYLWFIKTHPDIEKKFLFDNSLSVIKNLLNRYPNVVLLEPRTSQNFIVNNLKISAVMTIYGSVAHEYAFFNIPVINASLNNPHIYNKFCFNPRSIKELKTIILNIPKLKFKVNMNELLDFYYMHKIYFNKSWLGINMNKFISNNYGLENVNKCKEIDIKMLNYIKNHREVINRVEKFFNSNQYSL